MIVPLPLVVFSVVLLAYQQVSCQDIRLRRDLVDTQGLYANDSKVISLNATNFNTIYGTKNAWFLEFYVSWCGHCQQFAPIWNAFAEDITGWKDVVKIAAIDCAVESNTELCRDYNIQRYPTIRFFQAKSPRSNKGVEFVKRKNVDDIRHGLIDLLKTEQLEGRGENWPNISPLRSGPAADLWTGIPESIKYQIIIYENGTSYLGSELILDLHETKNIRVGRILRENNAAQNATQPSLVIIERNKEPQTLSTAGATREKFLAAVEAFLSSKGVHHTTGEHILNPESPTGQKGQPEVQYRSDTVYQVDLENAVGYSLKHEISTKDQISGEALVALKNYLSVLAKYFPIGRNGTTFFERLSDWVSQKINLRGKEFLDHVKKLEEELKPIFHSVDEWLGCRGSELRKRGYPCGMWTLFHTLTTNAVLQDGISAKFNNLEVLDTMVGYIKHFFGCRECSQHFQDMARESLHGNVSSPDDSIVWLWRAHNTVNNRLAGDVTEDPKHPKIQFPSEETCQSCRDAGGEWVTSEALQFLKQMYGRHSIDYTRWNGTVSALPNPEAIVPGNSGSSGWSQFSFPLILSAVAAAVLILFAVTW